MARLRIDDDTLEVTIEGIDRLLSFHRRLRIPLTDVTAVHADPATALGRGGLRSPGARIPGVVRAGTFREDGARVFWDVHHPGRAVVVELCRQSYDRLVLEVDDPDDAVRLVTDALPGRHVPAGPPA